MSVGVALRAQVAGSHDRGRRHPRAGRRRGVLHRQSRRRRGRRRSCRSPRRRSRRPVREYDARRVPLQQALRRTAGRRFAGYTWSRLWGNYGGLASSDENGRTSPNVERYFDGQYLVFDKSGNPVYGPAADRSAALLQGAGHLRHAVGNHVGAVRAGHLGRPEVDVDQPARLQPDVHQRPRRPGPDAGVLAGRRCTCSTTSGCRAGIAWT